MGVFVPFTIYYFTHRKGSIIVDYTVVFDDKNNNSYVADAVVQAIMELETVGNLIIDGKPVHVKPGIPVVSYLSFSNESLPNYDILRYLHDI